MMRFKSKVAIVTGGAGAIGVATARQLAGEGASVLLADVTPDGDQIARDMVEQGAPVAYCLADVSDEDQVIAMVKTAVDRWGRLDVMVANAGIAGLGRTNETTLLDWEKVIGVNLTGVFLCSKHAFPHMKAAGGGAIVNTASIGGVTGTVGAVAYTAAKGAVVNMTRSTALDYAKDRIRVNAVCPSFLSSRIRTMVGKPGSLPADLVARHPLGRLCEPEDVAKAIAFLASDDASFITATSLMVDGGYTAL